MKSVLAVAVLGAAVAMLGGCSSSHSNEGMASGNGGDMNQPMGMNANDQMDNGNTSNDLSQQDRQFVQKAAAGGAYEIQSSQLALEKTNSPRIRMVAQHMIHDHTEANQQLESLAKQKGIMVNASPDPQQQQMIDQLKGLNGTEFDQQYTSQQTQAHKQTIHLFKNEVSNGSDTALKAWAANTLPTLESHLRMVTLENNNDSNNNNMGNNQ